MSKHRRNRIGFVPNEPEHSDEEDSKLISDFDIVEATDRLVQWHGQNEEHFLYLLRDPREITWPVSIYDNHCQLSYLIVTDEPKSLSGHRFDEVLTDVARSVDDTVNTGWSMFYPFASIGPGAACFQPEHPDGTGEDVYEYNHMPDVTRRGVGLPDYWRIALDGRATIFRAFLEDSMKSDVGGNPVPDRWLSPETIIRDTVELITHSRFLARNFQSPLGVAFRCTWTGLKGRFLQDMNPAVSWHVTSSARANIRTTGSFLAMDHLDSDCDSARMRVACELSAPVLRVFGFTRCTPELIKRIAPRFKKL